MIQSKDTRLSYLDSQMSPHRRQDLEVQKPSLLALERLQLLAKANPREGSDILKKAYCALKLEDYPLMDRLGCIDFLLKHQLDVDCRAKLGSVLQTFNLDLISSGQIQKVLQLFLHSEGKDLEASITFKVFESIDWNHHNRSMESSLSLLEFLWDRRENYCCQRALERLLRSLSWDCLDPVFSMESTLEFLFQRREEPVFQKTLSRMVESLNWDVFQSKEIKYIPNAVLRFLWNHRSEYICQRALVRMLGGNWFSILHDFFCVKTYQKDGCLVKSLQEAFEGGHPSMQQLISVIFKNPNYREHLYGIFLNSEKVFLTRLLDLMVSDSIDFSFKQGFLQFIVEGIDLGVLDKENVKHAFFNWLVVKKSLPVAGDFYLRISSILTKGLIGDSVVRGNLVHWLSRVRLQRDIEKENLPVE